MDFDDNLDNGNLFPFTPAPERQYAGPVVEVDFVNMCQFPVDLFQMLPDRSARHTALIAIGKTHSLRTRAKCPWVARRNLDGMKTLLDGEFVYTAVVYNQDGEQEKRRVYITPRETTLKEKAARALVMKEESLWKADVRKLPEDARGAVEKIGRAGLEYRRIVCAKFVQKAIRPKTSIETDKRLRELKAIQFPVHDIFSGNGEEAWRIIMETELRVEREKKAKLEKEEKEAKLAAKNGEVKPAPAPTPPGPRVPIDPVKTFIDGLMATSRQRLLSGYYVAQAAQENRERLAALSLKHPELKANFEEVKAPMLPQPQTSTDRPMTYPNQNAQQTYRQGLNNDRNDQMSPPPLTGNYSGPPANNYSRPNDNRQGFAGRYGQQGNRYGPSYNRQQGPQTDRQHGTPSNRQQGTSSNRQQGSSSNRQQRPSSDRKQGNPSDRQHGSSSNRPQGPSAFRPHGPQTDRPNGPSSNRQQEHSSNRQHGASSNRQQGSSSNRQQGSSSDRKQGNPSDRQRGASSDRQVPPGNRHGHGNGHGDTNNRSAPSVQRHGSGSDRHGQSANRHWTNNDRSAPSPHRHGSTSDRHGSSSDRQGSSSDRHGSSSHRHGSASERHASSSSSASSSSFSHRPSSSSDRHGSTSARTASSNKRSEPTPDRNGSGRDTPFKIPKIPRRS